MPTSAVYRNTTVNVTTPRRVLDHTAVAVLQCMNSHVGRQVLHDDLKSCVAAHPGARVDLIAQAIKGLRNMGYPMLSTKARHLSWYTLAGTPDEFAAFAKRVCSEAYSEAVSTVRALRTAQANMPLDLLIGRAIGDMESAAIALGQRGPGLSTSEIVAELDILLLPTAAVTP